MGGYEPTGEAGDDRARRIEALRGLAGQAPSAQAAPGVGKARQVRAPRRALLAVLIIVVLVAGGVGAYLHSRPAGKPSTTATPPIPATLTLNAGTGQVGCPSSVAWSPDGRRLAVLAMKGNCAANEPLGLIFDTRTGKPLITLDLASALTAQHLSGWVTSVTWSPDGASVLFGAVVGSPTSTPLHPTVEPALLIFAADDTSARVLTGKPVLQAISLLPGAIWDVSAGQEVQAITGALPPAPAYRWTSDGHLAAAQSGDGTFPAWQPGTFVPIMSWDSAHDFPDFNAPPLAEGYIAIANQWSPDGRYLAMGLHTQHLVPPAPGQSLPALNPHACNTAGFFPPRNGCPKQATPPPDATFASIAHLARIGTHSHDKRGNTGLFWSPVPVAWRADGARLATILPDDGFNSGGEEYAVSIFKTGQTEPAARLSLSCPGMPCQFQWQPGNAGLAWSPAGTQLALLDPDSGLITIWGGSALPK